MRRLILCIALALAAIGGCGEDNQEGGRSGFWTSRQPAKGGAYRYRLLGIGVVLVIGTGYGVLRLVRRASRERDERNQNKPR